MRRSPERFDGMLSERSQTAQVFYSRAFHINGTTTHDGAKGGDITAELHLGLVNSAPYLMSALACL